MYDIYKTGRTNQTTKVLEPVQYRFFCGSERKSSGFCRYKLDNLCCGELHTAYLMKLGQLDRVRGANGTYLIQLNELIF
jgi:hypothetical protein